MEKNDERYNKIMANAREMFINELSGKLEEINMLFPSDLKELSMEKLQDILRFFHSINGTAATLGFEQIKLLGSSNELNIKHLIEIRENTNKRIKNDVVKAIDAISYQMSLLKTERENTCSTEEIHHEVTTDMGKILLIDDDIVALKLLESTFTSEGYTVYICDDSLSAIDIIETSRPDIILLDIMMPRCDGYELLKEIKANSKYSDTCIVFISAMDSTEDKLKGMKAGIDDYITKPFNIEEIVPRIEMVLRRANKFKERLLKDSLTGAYSRHYLNEIIGNKIEEYKRNNTVFSLAFLDIDFFKNINDTYGHNVGDFVLKELVGYLLKNLREEDSIIRYGGEEFVVLLCDTNAEKAYTIIERIRENFSKQMLLFENRIIDVTFSTGICQITDEIRSASKLLSYADKAMYLSKKSGRNRSTIFSYMDLKIKTKKTLLLVDDESTILKLLSIKLSETGYDIIIAENGVKAMGLIDTIQPDAIILDRILPDMDGLEVCKAVKQNERTKFIPIIILSQKKKEQDIEEGYRSGADDYITKPFSISELETRIMKIL